MNRNLLLAAVLISLGCASAAFADSVLLNADTPATGSDLDIMPLVTPYGTITFVGEIIDHGSDPEFNAAGAAGDVFDIVGNNSRAQLSFSFDVSSVTFIYGGNIGVFDIVARDINGAVVDSFFQADTNEDQPAGPVTLHGLGIRSLFWQD